MVWLAATPPADAILTRETVVQKLRNQGATRRESLETLDRFYEAARAGRRLEALADQRQALAALISMNERRFGEGVIAERDLIRVRVEASRVDVQLTEARLAFEQALTPLAGLLNLKVNPGAVRITQDFDESPAPLNREALGATGKRPPENMDRNSWLRDIEETATGYEAAREQIQTFKLRLLQQVDESYFIEKLLYEQLKTDLLTLLDAQRTRTEVRLAYSEALHAAATSRLRLRYLLGEDGLP
jgi:outer membrane protein TolC